MAEESTVTQKSGFLDVKQPACVKGRKLKSWRKRWVVVTKMADLTTGNPTAKLDLFAHHPTSSQGQGRVADRLTFVLEHVTNVQPCRSKTRPFAFEVVQDTAVLVLSGSSDVESEAWTAALCNIFFADRNASPGTDSYSVTVCPSTDSERLGLIGLFTLCIGPDAVSLTKPALAQADSCSTTLPHQTRAVTAGRWTLAMLMRFKVEREPATGLPRIFLLHCGPNSPCGEAIFHFLSDEAGSILASVRKVISVAMATRQHPQPSFSVMKTGSEPLMTTAGAKERSASLHNPGLGSAPASVKVGHRSLRSGSGSGSSVCSVTPRSSLNEAVLDSSGESSAEEGLTVCRGLGVSVGSTLVAEPATSPSDPCPTASHAGQPVQEHTGQRWQAERDRLWQHQQQQQPLQGQPPDRSPKQHSPHRQHSKSNDPPLIFSPQKPKETLAVEQAWILQQVQQQQQQQQHERFQQQERQDTLQQFQWQRPRHLNQRKAQETGSPQHAPEDKSTTTPLLFQQQQQQQQQSEPWPTAHPVTKGAGQCGQTWEPAWPQLWLEPSDGRSELVLDPRGLHIVPHQGGATMTASSARGRESGGTAPPGTLVPAEPSGCAGPDGDSRGCLEPLTAGSAEPDPFSHDAPGIQPAQEEPLSTSKPSILTSDNARNDETGLASVVAETSLSNTTGHHAELTGPFPLANDPYLVYHPTLSCQSALSEPTFSANETGALQWETALTANHTTSCQGKSARPADEMEACQCDYVCACPADHVAECGCDSSKQHVYQSVDAVRDEEPMNHLHLGAHKHALGRRSLSTGDVSREHQYEELDAFRPGKEAFRLGLGAVSCPPPDLPARPPFFLLTTSKPQHMTKTAPLADFLLLQHLSAAQCDDGQEKMAPREIQSPDFGDRGTALLSMSQNTDHYSVIDDAACVTPRRCLSLDATPGSSRLHLRNGDGSIVLKTPQASRSTGILNSRRPADCKGAMVKASTSCTDTSRSAPALGSSGGVQSSESANSTRALMGFFLDDFTFHENPMVTGELAAAKAPQAGSAHSGASSLRSFDELGTDAVREDQTDWARFEDHAEELRSAPSPNLWPATSACEGSRQSELATTSSCFPSPPHTHASNGLGRGRSGEGVYMDMKGQSTDDPLQEDSEYVSPSQLSSDNAFFDLLQLR